MQFILQILTLQNYGLPFVSTPKQKQAIAVTTIIIYDIRIIHGAQD
jgi:hypothetical protein